MPVGAQASSIGPLQSQPGEAVQDTLRRLRGLKGVRGVLVVDAQGSCISSSLPAGSEVNSKQTSGDTVSCCVGVWHPTSTPFPPSSLAHALQDSAQQYVALVAQVTKKAAQLMALLEEGEDEGGALQLVRLNSKHHEVVMSPGKDYCLVVISQSGLAGETMN